MERRSMKWKTRIKEKIIEPENWFCDKIDETDKSLFRRKGEIERDKDTTCQYHNRTTESTDVKRITREYYTCLCL